MKIYSFSFGCITIDGNNYEDIKIIGDEIIPWSYIKHHTVTLGDVLEIVDSKPEAVVIGIGTSSLVTVEEDVTSLLDNKKITYFVLDSEFACRKYNELREKGKKVCAIIHSTC